MTNDVELKFGAQTSEAEKGVEDLGKKVKASMDGMGESLSGAQVLAFGFGTVLGEVMLKAANQVGEMVQKAVMRFSELGDYLDHEVASGALHVHDHDHDHDHDGSSNLDGAGPDSIASQIDDGTSNHIDDGHSGSHAHPTFSMIPLNCAAGPSYGAPDLPPPSFSATFTSHIPPLFDRPPTARV